MSGWQCPGNPEALHQMISGMIHGGKIALLGSTADEAHLALNTVVFNGLTLKGIYGRRMYETWYKMSAMVNAGLDIRPVITYRLHYSDFEQGIELMHQGQCGKVVLEWR